MKNLSLRKYIAILSLALAILSAAFLFYVADSITKYESNQLDNYMANFMEELKDVNNEFVIVGADSVRKSNFDRADASLRSGLAYLAANDSLAFRQGSEGKNSDNPVFDVFDGDNPLLRVTLNAKDSATRLGILSFNIWEVKEVKLLTQEGLFNYEISVPYSYGVEVNGRKLTEKQSADSLQFIGLADISKKVNLSWQANYILEGLIDAPEIKVTDQNGKLVECEAKGTRINKRADCETISDETTAKSKIWNYPNIHEMAREWSLFLSNDLHGGNRGYDVVKEFLIEGTYLCHYAYHWSQSVDITYVGAHGFAKERFSNEKACNFEIYSDKEFSCDVFLDKNLSVHGGLVDKMAERIHFVCYDDSDDGKDNPTWRILSMKAITGK